LSLQQLHPNLLIREMVERWLEKGDALDDAAPDSSAGCLAAHLRQQLQRQASDDPLSTFGASSSTSSTSSRRSTSNGGAQYD